MEINNVINIKKNTIIAIITLLPPFGQKVSLAKYTILLGFKTTYIPPLSSFSSIASMSNNPLPFVARFIPVTSGCSVTGSGTG